MEKNVEKNVEKVLCKKAQAYKVYGQLAHAVFKHQLAWQIQTAAAQENIVDYILYDEYPASKITLKRTDMVDFVSYLADFVKDGRLQPVSMEDIKL